MNPMISVLMSVYNGERFLREAIDSILGQTVMDFEFIILDGGSMDHSIEIIESYGDNRIRLVRSETDRLSLVDALNKGIKLARGKYIARMDCDDISMPERFAEQVAYLESHPDVGIVASDYQFVDGQKESLGALEPEEVKFQLLFHCCLAHPAVMMRKEMLERYQLSYRPVTAEDYDLWVRASRCFQVMRTSRPLLRYRRHGSQLTQTNALESVRSTVSILKMQLEELGVVPSEAELLLHNEIGVLLLQKKELFAYKDIDKKVEWLRRLRDRNEMKSIYSQAIFDEVINKIESEYPKYRAILDTIMKKADTHRLFLFGMGRYGEQYQDLFASHGITIEGIIDNNPMKWGAIVNGVQVVSPQTLIELSDRIFVIIASTYAYDMAKQLEELGLIKQQDYIIPHVL